MPLPTMVTPKEYIKRMMEGVLQLDGRAPGKPLDDLVERLFSAVFNKDTKASVQQCLLDIEEE